MTPISTLAFRNALNFLILLTLLFFTSVCSFADGISLDFNSARFTKVLTNTDSSSLYDSPVLPLKNQLFTEAPAFTGGSYRVSGNYVRFPTDIKDIISKAKSERKGLEVFAIHLSISGVNILSGIPYLKLISHNCILPNRTYIYTFGIRPSYPFQTATTGVTPPKPPAVTHSGHVDILCTQITSPGVPSLYVYTYGRAGTAGRRGGPGRKGIDGTPGGVGYCKSKKFLGFRYKCKTSRGYAGRPSTAGTNGANGGSGGNGGNGGNVNLIYDSIARHPLTVRTNEAGGRGGSGGIGGAAGTNGKYIAPINYVTGCASKCRVRFATENRPRLPPLTVGRRGTAGISGRRGVTTISTILNSVTTTIRDEDILRSLLLAERYYNDRVLSGSLDEASSIMDSIYSLSKKRAKATGTLGLSKMNPMIQTIGDRANMAKKTLQLERSLFGPAVLSRTAPISIGKELRSELQYMEALKDQMTSSKLESNVLAVVTAAAAISIPATDFTALRRDLKSQRDTFRRAVIEAEAQVEVATATIAMEVEKYINKKKDEADRARQGRIFKAIKAVVNIAVGVASINFKETFSSVKTIIGTIKNIKVSFEDISAIKSTVEDIKEEFKQLKNETKAIKKLLDTASDIKGQIDVVTDAFKKAETASCTFSDIKALMQAAPDRIDKFPNLVVYDSDFSKIDDIGVVSELSKAFVTVRASKLTSQFGCVLGENLDAVPSVKTAFDNFFTWTETRIKILARMVDIDIELRKLQISEQGVLAQKNSLQILRSSVSIPSRSNALTVLGAVFEKSRLRVLETVERLANSYGNIVLRDMQKIIKNFAIKQLVDNGLCGFDPSKQYSTILKLHVDLKAAYQVAHQCTAAREIPAVAHYSFEITASNSPELFAGGLRVGTENGIALKLDIENNCAFYGGNHPPKRGMRSVTPSQSACFPNLFTYNARMISIAVELVGGNESLLPEHKKSVFSTIDQFGVQTFHAKPGTFKKLDMTPLQFGLGFLSLTNSGPKEIVYQPTCFVGGGGLTSVNVDSPRVCPSPFSTYSLRIGYVKDVSLEPYLASIKAIRIHTKLVAFSRRDTANICFE